MQGREVQADVGKMPVLIILICVMMTFSGCFANQPSSVGVVGSNHQKESQAGSTAMKQEAKAMKLYIDKTEVPVTWEDSSSVADLQAHLPLTIQMSRYGGNEQVGSIGRNIVRADKETTTHYGDIVLYSGNKIVIFYGSNSWAYTRLGHVNLSQQEMTDLLSRSDVRITIAKE